MPNRELPYKNLFQNAVTFEMSLNQKQYFRRVYSLLDFLSDVGGLYSAVSPICMLLIVLMNFNSSY